MKLYRNQSEIKRKEKLGRRLSLVGLIVLFIGLLCSFIPTWYPPDQPAPGAIGRFLQEYWTWISFAALPAGFILASFGSYYINRFARRRWPGSNTIARPDEVLERSMKGFDDKYAYFAWSLPASHVLVGPCGVLILVVRSDRGRVTVTGDKWKEPFSFGRFFTIFAREGVGNPAMDIQEQQRKIQELIGKACAGNSNGQGNASDPAVMPIDGAVVFLNQEMQLNLDNPTVQVLRTDQVKDYVRRKAKDVKMNSEKLRVVSDCLRDNSVYQEE